MSSQTKTNEMTTSSFHISQIPALQLLMKLGHHYLSPEAALEARAISLYEKLMEKQMSFKEAVEPFKTDNQNAGKA